MTMKKRIDHIEAQLGGGAPFRPSVIIVSSPGGEAGSAILVHGGTISRHDDETEKAFIARAESHARGIHLES